MLYLGSPKSDAYHFYDLNSKYHQDKKFFVLEKYDKNELENWQVFKDHHFHQTDFKNDIFMFHDGDVHLFDKMLSFDNVDSFIHKVSHPDIMELGYTF